MTVIINGTTGITLADGSSLGTTVLYVNNQTISATYTMTANTSASITGPVNFASNVSFTLPAGTRVVVL